MKAYLFPYGGSFGPGDSWEGANKVELTDKEAERLEASAKLKPRRELKEDPEIADIYKKVYRKLYKHDLDELLEDEYRMEELREDYEEENGMRRISDKTLAERYLEETTFNVFYPEELQNL